MMRVVAAALVVAAVLAGCSTVGDPDVPLAGDGTSTLPPGCSADRVAVMHQGGALLVPPAGTVLPVGCLRHTGVDSSEPTLGIASDGTVFHYPAALIDRDTPAAAGVRFLTGVARSQDEGDSWRILLPTAGPTAPTHQASLDPYFYLDRATDRIWADDLITPNCSVLSWSDDLGETWMNSLSGCIETDHQTLFTGPPVTSTTVGYPNILYRCSINLVALDGSSTAATCTKSLDGGLTNVPTGEPVFVSEPERLPEVCSGAVGHGVTGPDGTIYLPKGHCGVPMLGISHDEGQSWTRVVVSDLPMAAGEHDAGVGVDAAGNVHYMWIAEDRLPYLVTSQDGGQTWCPTHPIGPPGLREAHLPAAQAGGEGKVAWAYFGSFDATADEPGVETSWHLMMGWTLDALQADPVVVTAFTNDPADPVARGACATVRCNDAVKDFIHLEIGPDGTPWTALVDGCLDACRRGEQAEIDGREGAVARLWGGPSLWDAADPNGPYP